jgi:hypothetical protein
LRNTNERSNQRGRESAADVAGAVRAGLSERFEQERADLGKLHDRVRDSVEAQLKAAGADHSALANKVEQRLDALRADHATRLREDQSREKGALDRQQTAAPGAAAKSAEQSLDEIRELERGRDELLAKLSAEAVAVRDALVQDVQDVQRNRQAVADLNTRLEDALERNRKQVAVIEGVRQEARGERDASAGDPRKQAALDRDIAALDQRLEAYRARTDALNSTSKLIEQQRLELAGRFLDQVKLADGGRRRSLDKEQDQQHLDRVRDAEKTRTVIENASQFAVLDRKFSDLKPIKELWERAAASAKADESLKGRELYERAMDSFKRLLANEQDKTARDARELFEKDGLRFARDEQGKLKAALPMLDDPYVQGRLDMARHSDLLRVSGQHLEKLEKDGDPVDPRNLAFMIARDNMQMDVKGPLSEYVRKKVVDRLRDAGVEEDEAEAEDA